MIEITMSTKDFVVMVKGHAQPEESELYRETCSAASMLVQGLAHSIAKLENTQDAIMQFDYRDEPGNMLMHIIPKDWAKAAVRKRMKIYADGMELLAMSNPESVRMIFDGVPVKPEEGEQDNE